VETKHVLKNAYLRHPSFTIAMYRRKSASPVHNVLTMFVHGEVLAPCPTPKLEDHPSSAVCDCLFNIFAATLHIGGCSSIHNLRTRCAVVTGTHLSRNLSLYIIFKFGLRVFHVLPAHPHNFYCHNFATNFL